MLIRYLSPCVFCVWQVTDVKNEAAAAANEQAKGNTSLGDRISGSIRCLWKDVIVGDCSSSSSHTPVNASVLWTTLSASNRLAKSVPLTSDSSYYYLNLFVIKIGSEKGAIQILLIRSFVGKTREERRYKMVNTSRCHFIWFDSRPRSRRGVSKEKHRGRKHVN